MRKTAVVNLVGLTPRLLARMPRLRAWAARGTTAAIDPVLPAVTCSVQASYLTGTLPAMHGIVGNGWFDRDTCEVRFWHQSNRLVQGRKLWETARTLDSRFTCANLFWWYNMYSSADVAVTPRPCYPADGRKIPDIYTHPPHLRETLQAELGQFPLFAFWGPQTHLRASEWIAEAARRVDERFAPTLLLVYLPHLDYNLQRFGPLDPRLDADLAAVDNLCVDLIAHFAGRGRDTLVLSEYGITEVARAVHVNRVLRAHGLLAVREELGRELLDTGGSSAFAVADHQVAHVYVASPERVPAVRRILERIDGVERVFDREEQAQWGIAHPRAGDLVLVAQAGAWFTYYYWLEDGRAPDFARTVDIHRKPGYDPVELFLDPAIALPRATVAWKLVQRAVRLRTLLDVIPLDAGLVKGSHGRPPDSPLDGPMLLSQERLPGSRVPATAVHDVILAHCLPDETRHARFGHSDVARL